MRAVKPPANPLRVCEELGLTQDSQPGRSGSDGCLDGLALIHGVILQVSSQDFQVVLT